jgi:transcriptional regulator with XRE-family HTH domain
MKTMTSYTHYNFVDKDPIIDRVATIIKGMGLSLKEVEKITGISYSTLRAMFIGKTVSPKFSTIARVVIGLGQSDISVVEQKQANVVRFQRTSQKRVQGIRQRVLNNLRE